jgi:hypothetical protein
MDASMRVSFEATLDDFVDVNVRSMKRTGLWNNLRVNMAIVSGILGALIIFGPSSFTSLSIESRLTFAAIAGVVFASLSWLLLPRTLERRFRDYFRSSFGTSRTRVIQVELDAQGISFTQLGKRSLHEWSAIQAIQTGSDRIDMLFSNKGLATVRARAFESPTQQKEFVDLANEYIKANRQTTSISNAPSG